VPGPNVPDGGDVGDASVADAATSEGSTPGDGSTTPPLDGGTDACATVDITSDPKNCGYCGHDCRGGGCNGGSCEAFLVANLDASAASVTENSNGVYWVATGGKEVLSCPRSGCKGSASVLSGSLTNTVALTAVGSDLAVLDVQDIQHVTTPAGAAVLIYPKSGTIDTSSVICTDEKSAYVYFRTYSSSAGQQVATRILVDGGDPLQGTYVTNNQLKTIGCGAGHFAWMLNPNPDTIYACSDPADCGAPGSIAAGSNNDEVHIAATSTMVFYSRRNANTLNACPLEGCTSPTVIGTPTDIDGIAVDDTYVYFTSGSGGTVSRCAQAGCGNSLTVLANGQPNPHALLVTKDAVYWATDAIPPSGNDAGMLPGIWRIAK
jgi:hypothetical protein